jgi:hypothetical protein
LKPHERVAGMLLARRWALAVLADAQPDNTPDLPPEVWRKFLALERCAAVLLSRARNAASLSRDALDTLRAAAAIESQSALRACAEGHDLSEIASRLDFPMIVLKGGARAVAGLPPTLPLADIDVLVERSQVASVTSLLRAAGFGEPAPATRHHQGISPAADRLAIEVHWTTNDDGTDIEPGVWKRIRPIPGVRALMQLGAWDNLEHILRHAVTVHGDRSIALRDVILAGISARECEPEQVHHVRRQISRGRHATLLEAMLDLSIELAQPSGRIPPDVFERETAAFYAATVAQGEGTKQLASRSALAFLTEISIGRISLREAPSRAFIFRGTGNRTLARLAADYPRIVKPLIGAAHAGYYGLAAVVLLPRIRRIASAALREIGPQTR